MGICCGMTTSRMIRFLAPAALTAGAAGLSMLTSAPGATAQPCPATEVVFARGTGEPPGVGPTGQAFIDALGARLGGKPVAVYPVNYPASDAWATGIDGVRDASDHVISMAANCPATKMVLGGFSQGAAVMGFVTSSEVPEGIDPTTVPKPLQPEVADHVAAVVLFGTPNVRAMNFLNQPPVAIGPLYQAKTIQLCVPEDAVCSEGMNFGAHNSYPDEGNLVNQGADFAAGRLQAGPHGPAPAPQRHGFTD